MFFVRKSHSTPVLFILAGMLLVTSCVVDKSYDISPSDIDLSVTLLEDGLTVPIGSSEKISLGDLINSAGEGINDFIETGSNGELILKYEGSTSLNDQLSDLDLKDMAVIDGVSFNEDFTYNIGDFDPDNFKIDGSEYDIKAKFDGLDLLSIKTSSISTSADNLKFQAGLDKLKDVMKDNDDLDLSKKIGNVTHNQTVLKRSEVSDKVAAHPSEKMEIGKDIIDNVTVDKTNVKVEVEGITLHEDVSAVSNLKTDPNAKMVVEMSLTNVFFTEGTAEPKVTLDFSKLFKIKGGSKITIDKNVDNGAMVLKTANGWKVSKTYDVEGLATTSYNGKIVLSEDVVVEGDITLNDLATTKTSFNSTSGDIAMNIKVSFTDLTIVSADLAVKVDPFEKTDNISFGDFEETALPNGIKDVKAVYLDESKPITLKIVPKNLDKLKEKKLDYVFTLDFPNSIKVKDAVNGKLEFSGDLAGGAVEKKIVLQEFTPTVKDGKVSLDANVGVTAKVTPSGLVVDSTNLPSSADEDLSFSVTVEGQPEIKDFLIQLGEYDESMDEMKGEIKIEAEGLGDFSGVHITPEGSPALVVKFNIPTIKGLSLKPGANGVKVVLPNFIVFNGSAIPAAYNFNAADNSIILKDSFPAQLSLPIKELYVKPMIVDGKTMIVGSYSATGSISIPSAEVSQDELQETFGTDIGIVITVPDIKAASISLDDKLSFDIDQKFDLTVKNIPEELVKINEILLDDVYVNMEAAFDGLPNSTPFAVDLTITLPDFISPNVVPIKGNVVNGKLTATPVKLEKLYNIEPVKIKDAKTGEEYNGLKGSIEIKGGLSADGANIDVHQLKSDITASIKASIQNKDGKIALSKASGVFSYDIEQETSLELDTLPDALKGDNLCLDLGDPQLNLDISTNLGIPMSATLELIPYVNGSAVESNKVTLNNVQLPCSEDATKTSVKKYTICKAASSAPAGREFIEANISNLLKQIPDKLTIKIIAGVDPNQTSVLEPSATYTLDIAYGINVPLSFGKDFSFTTDTELDLSGAASVIAMGDFGLKGKVLNDSPLNLSVQLDLLDPDGKVVPQSKSSSINIAGAKTSDFEIFLSPSDKSREIKSAKLTIKVSAIPDVPVKESDCLQFLNLVAVSASGITVNPSK